MAFQGSGLSSVATKNVVLWAFNATLSKVQPLTANTVNQLIAAVQFPDSGGVSRSVNASLLNGATLPATNYGLDTLACVYGWDADLNIMRRVTVGNTSSNVSLARPALCTFSTNFVYDAQTGEAGLQSGTSDITDTYNVNSCTADATAFNLLFNEGGSAWEKLRALPSDTDHQNASQVGLLGAVTRLQVFNGTGFDFLRASSADNVSSVTQPYSLMVSSPGDWTLTDAPAVATAASASKAAGGATVRHVLTSIAADLTAVAAIAAPLTLVVRDGATGVGAILWQRRLTSPAGQTKSIELSGLNIVGSLDTEMTVEFTAAPAATDFQTISATGHSVA